MWPSACLCCFVLLRCLWWLMCFVCCLSSCGGFVSFFFVLGLGFFDGPFFWWLSKGWNDFVVWCVAESVFIRGEALCVSLGWSVVCLFGMFLCVCVCSLWARLVLWFVFGSLFCGKCVELVLDLRAVRRDGMCSEGLKWCWCGGNMFLLLCVEGIVWIFACRCVNCCVCGCCPIVVVGLVVIAWWICLRGCWCGDVGMWEVFYLCDGCCWCCVCVLIWRISVFSQLFLWDLFVDWWFCRWSDVESFVWGAWFGLVWGMCVCEWCGVVVDHRCETWIVFVSDEVLIAWKCVVLMR